jgi:soluble lytic murein transglycosylase-like protein
MGFCFTIGLGGLLAAQALLGAEAPAQPSHLTSVVRADPQTGRLVRRVMVAPKAVTQRAVPENVVISRVVSPFEPVAKPGPEPPPAGIDDAVARIAAEHALPEDLLHSVIKVESNYNPFAVSPKGALGIMQLIPETARRFGVGNVFNPIDNIQGGARYLRYLLDLYHGNYGLALAAYNAGEAAVAKYGGIPPYAETQKYVVQVRNNWAKPAARKAQPAAPQPAPAPAPVATPGDAPARIQAILETDGTVRYVSR